MCVSFLDFYKMEWNVKYKRKTTARCGDDVWLNVCVCVCVCGDDKGIGVNNWLFEEKKAATTSVYIDYNVAMSAFILLLLTSCRCCCYCLSLHSFYLLFCFVPQIHIQVYTLSATNELQCQKISFSNFIYEALKTSIN